MQNIGNCFRCEKEIKEDEDHVEITYASRETDSNVSQINKAAVCAECMNQMVDIFGKGESFDKPV